MTPGARVAPMLAQTLAWVAVFSVAFALVEASVVIYLRALYYPEGFAFPLRVIPPGYLRVEIAREAATLVMLGAVAIVAGRKSWERFGYFLFAFGLWDLFFYIWLLVTVGWPSSLLEWDILFLIPVPWIGPVVAPLLISLCMIVCGAVVVRRSAGGLRFQPRSLSWALGTVGTILLLCSFMLDPDAGIRGAPPAPYHYELLAGGLIAYVAGFVMACRAESHAEVPGPA